MTPSDAGRHALTRVSAHAHLGRIHGGQDCFSESHDVAVETVSLPECCLRRFAVRLAVASGELDFQAFFAARHRPAMVGAEDWFEDRGEEF